MFVGVRGTKPVKIRKRWVVINHLYPDLYLDHVRKLIIEAWNWFELTKFGVFIPTIYRIASEIELRSNVH